MINNKIFVRVLRKIGLLKKIRLITTINLYNKKILVPINAEIGFVNIYQEENWLGKFIQRMDLLPDETFLDVGVNVGQALLQLKSNNEHVNFLGFEPNISCCNYVNELIKLNQFTKCEILNLALSKDLQLVNLEFDSETDARASINQAQRPNYFKNKVKVLSIPFDLVYQALNISLIKIDVEGAELNVIKGLKNQIIFSKPTIICEVLDSHNEEVFDFTANQAQELFDFMKQLDYECIQLVQNKQLNQIVDFKILDKLEIQIWTEKSSRFNDYIFVSKSNMNKVEKLLTEIKS